MKDEFLANLLKSGNMSTPHNKLVSVVVDKESDSGESIEVSKSTSAQVEGPTMMEMMMAAHLDAKNEKVLSEDIEAKKTTKHFGTGFKKGFFTGTTEKKSHNVDNGTVAIPMNEKEAYLSWMQNKGEDAKEKTVDIPTIRRKNAGSRNISHASREKVCLGSDSGPTASINADVQKAMIEDEAPILKELKQGDWVTPDLLEIFQKNEIIKNGLKNSKCTAAMHMMQSDPKEARKRFEGDVEVDTFLREFGRVMSGHFEKLGSEKDSVASSGEKNATNDKKKSVPLISECVSSSGSRGQNKNKIIENNRSLELGDAKAVNSSSTHGISSSSSYGILQAEAIERHRQGKELDAFGTAGPRSSTPTLLSDLSVERNGNRNSRGADGVTDEERDKERVKKIVTDVELSSLLLDVEFQQVLKDCNDPLKYHRHMSNPDTAKKIKKMFEAGLVATVK